jgi:uroporphyrinogen III methyltransferase/synthase
MPKSKVYLVGSGPGDPDLITQKAIDCLRSSDVIIYDNLANIELLNYAKDDSEKIYVGKKANLHTLSQEKINELIIKKAQEGKIICRLKGGDPFIFGRGGEEAEELVANNIEFEIIPGITSAIAAPTYAGIPITHRKYTSMVTFITGHEDPEKDSSNISWDFLAKSNHTCVFLMGVKNLENIINELIKKGKSKNTPCAIISNGTLPKQKMISGTLNNIFLKAKREDIKPPSIIVVGDVVNLSSKLAWYTTKKLFGKSILNTRSREQASKLTKILNQYGACVYEFPLIKIEPIYKNIDKEISKIENYDYLIFTSENASKYFFNRFFEHNFDARKLYKSKICAIGEGTKKEIEKNKIHVDVIPNDFTQEGLVEYFKKINLKNAKILLLRALDAREVLPNYLIENGADLSICACYESKLLENESQKIEEKLKSGEIDIITFTSSGIVKNFFKIFKENASDYLNRAKVFAIGPITRDTLIDLGVKNVFMPEKYTIESLVEKIILD